MVCMLVSLYIPDTEMEEAQRLKAKKMYDAKGMKFLIETNSRPGNEVSKTVGECVLPILENRKIKSTSSYMRSDPF